MSYAALRLGTRGSALALAQSQLTADALTAATGRPVELVRIVTAGRPVRRPGRPARRRRLRLRAARRAAGRRDRLRRALVQGPAHRASTPALHIAAVPPREDPRDALIARDGLTLAELPAGLRDRHRRGAPNRATACFGPTVAGHADPRERRQPHRPGARPRGRSGRRRSRPGRRGPSRPRRPRSPKRSTRCSCCPPRPRVRWRSSAGPTTPTWSSCWPRSTTHRPGPPSWRNGRCSPRWRPGAPPRSRHTPSSPKASDGDEIYLRGAVISPDGARAIRLSRTGTPADAAEIGKALAADLLDAGADTLMGSTE